MVATSCLRRKSTSSRLDLANASASTFDTHSTSLMTLVTVKKHRIGVNVEGADFRDRDSLSRTGHFKVNFNLGRGVRCEKEWVHDVREINQTVS